MQPNGDPFRTYIVKEAQMDSKTDPLDTKDLIDLFKHWDTRVSHQENLFVPLAAAGLPAVAVAWKDITTTVVFVVALASIGLYLFYLLTIHRIGTFQDNIFEELKSKDSNFDTIVRRPKNRLGVRHLRALALPFLSILWAIMLFAKLGGLRAHITTLWWVAIAVLVVAPTLLTWYLWRDMPAES